LCAGFYMHRATDSAFIAKIYPALLTNASYWSNKLVRNQLRDQVTMSALTGMNWSYLIVWECEATNAGRCALLAKLVEFLR